MRIPITRRCAIIFYHRQQRSLVAGLQCEIESFDIIAELEDQTHLCRQASGSDYLERGHPLSKPEAGLSPANAASAHIQGMLLGRAWRGHGAGQKAKALSTGLRALTANPSDLKAWKSLVALVLKAAGGKSD